MASAWNRSKVTQTPGGNYAPSLTPIQHWLLDHDLNTDDYWNQSIEIRLPQSKALSETTAQVRESLAAIVNAHDALRTRVTTDGQSISLPKLAADDIPSAVLDATGLGDKEVEAALDQATRELNQQIHVGGTSTIGAVLIALPDDCRLHMIANHFAIDAVSWSIIIEDLKQTMMSGPDEHSLVPGDASYARWASALRSAAESGRFRDQLEYWRSILTNDPPLPAAANSSSNNLVTDRQAVSGQLDTETTRQLRDDLRGSRVSVHELLVAALASTLSGWSGQNKMRILIERHGREPIEPEVDYSQTVGWFTSLAPIGLNVSDHRNPESFVPSVKDQLRSVPDNGVGFGVLRYLDPDPDIRHSLRLTGDREVLFNFLGRSMISDNGPEPFGVTRQLGLHRSPNIRLQSALEIHAVLQTNLCVTIEFDRNQFQHAKMAEVLAQYLSGIRSAVQYCVGEGAAEATSSDFPLAGMDEDQLQDLAALLDRKNSGSEES